MTSRRQFFKVSALLGTAGVFATSGKARAARSWSNITFGRPATDVGIGADGSYWVLGRDEKPGGYGLYRLDGSDIWQPDAASPLSSGVRIAVDEIGQPWTVTDNHQIWRRISDTTWRQMPGTATDIGIGAYGGVWIVGTDPKPGGYGLWQWAGKGWVPDESPGASGVRIGVDGRSQPWVVNDTGEIWRRNKALSWSKMSASATDISVGSNSYAWAIGSHAKAGGYDILSWGGYAWAEDSVSAASAGLQIAVSNTGNVVTVNSAGEIWELGPWS